MTGGPVSGFECPGCGLRSALDGHLRCPDCGSDLAPATFDGHGVVWSWTVIHPVDAAPYGLAYVDLDGGPRTLARFEPVPDAVRCGRRVVIQEIDGIARLDAGAPA